MMIRKTEIATLASLLLGSGPAMGDIIGVLGAPGAPPPTQLGPYEMTPFPPDPRPLGEYVSTVPSPLGGDFVLSVEVIHKLASWLPGAWGHGYVGDTYQVWGNRLDLELPPATRAIYLSIKADSDGDYFEVVADDRATLSATLMMGGGARSFGFFVDSADGPDMHRISIWMTGWVLFHIGEFGVAVPEPGTFALVLLALLLMRRR